MLIRPSRRDLLSYAGASAAVSLLSGAAPPPQPWDRAADIARTVKPPAFPSRLFDITAFGAKGDRTTLNSAAIARAITACSEAGGGRVFVPAGIFLTGPVHLKSNIELNLAEGATLLFSTDTAHYPLVLTRW